LHIKATGPGPALLDVVIDFTITYRDFGITVNITAPPNSVPYQAPPPIPQPVNPGQPPAPPPAGPSPVDLARALADAYNAGDLARAQAIVAPGTRFVNDPGTPFASDVSLADFIAQAKGTHVTIDSL